MKRLAALLLGLLLPGYRADAGSTTWNGAVSTDWNTAGNWPGGIPILSVDATFGSVATTNYTANIAAAAAVKYITFATGANAGAFTITGTSSLTIGNAAGVVNNSAFLQTLDVATITLTNAAPTFTAGSLAGGGFAFGGTTLNLAASSLLTVTGTNNTTILNAITGSSSAITKTGTGTLSLLGASTYTGATAASAGTLNVTGSLTSAMTVASGATLSGPGGTTSSTLALNAGSTIIGEAQVAGAGTAFRAAGAVTAGTSVLISGSDGSATVGAGHVIDVVGYGTTPGTANFSTANYRSATLADDATSKKITLTYTNAARTWNSAASTWDVMTTAAWQEGDFKFSQGDTVTFNDTGTGGGGARTVTLNSLVTPGGVTFNNSTSTYTVNGTGSIGSAATLAKTGTGTVNLNTTNTFTGNTTVSGGTLALNADGALGGTTKVTINTGGTVLLGATTGNNRINTTAEIALAGGTFHTGGFSESVGKMTLSGNSTLDLGNGASILTFNGASSLGSSTLTVLNWTGTQGSAGGTDQLIFTGSSFIGGTSTSQVQFNIGGTYYGANFISLGGGGVEAVASLTPVPEPATIFGASALVLAIGWRERKRLAPLLRRI